MYAEMGSPLTGAALARLKAFLRGCGLDYDESIGFTAMIMEDGEILAAGSLDGNTVKCVAVSPAHQGEDLAAQVMTMLVQEAAQRGVQHLMLYTKPHNQHLFEPLGFHSVMRTGSCLLMENRRGGFAQYLSSLPVSEEQPVGCIVANCNPFTLGHRYLIETAARECACVHVFILSENRGMFPADMRLEMARAGCKDLPNVLVHPTGPYMISSATFPDYFIKDKARSGDIHCELDLRLFGERIAPALHIARRYVGTEPSCPVTARYNEQMKQILPRYGVEVIEIERKTARGAAVSASHVRSLMEQKRFDALDELLPPSSIEMIRA